MKKYIPRSWQDMRKLVLTVTFVLAAFFLVLGADGVSAQSTQSGSVGLTGTTYMNCESLRATDHGWM